MEQMNNEKKNCYCCDEVATTVEHVPPKGFFPSNKRVNLITVPSCAAHNLETSNDDEYVRNVLSTYGGNNHTGKLYWKDKPLRSFQRNSKLFSQTFQKLKGDKFFIDRKRMDDTMVKIAYALYFKEFGKRWTSQIEPYYEDLLSDEGKSDIELRLQNYKSIPTYNDFSGNNPEVFKYYFLEGRINKKNDCFFKMVFYGGFTVLVLPKNDQKIILRNDGRKVL